MSKKVIGIYAGTFDPVHDGHVAFARAAIDHCQIDKVVFLPEAKPRHKNNVTSLAQRKAWLAAAIEKYSDLTVGDVRSTQFTIHRTMPELTRRYPDNDFALLIGSDIVLGSLPFWPDIAAFLKRTPLIIGLRGEHAAEMIAAELDKLGRSHSINITHQTVETPERHISSTLIRSRQ